MDSDEVGRLHCFRHMGARLEAAAAAVEQLMTAEFVRVARPTRLRAAALPPSPCTRREWRSSLRFVAWKRFLMALGLRPGIILASSAHWLPTRACSSSSRFCSSFVQGRVVRLGCR